MMKAEKRDIRLFNTPVEYGLRALFILSSMAPRKADLQRLIYLDYLVLHISDVDPDQISLHPSYPHRSGEILVKRERLKNGLLIMKSRQLLSIKFDGAGITYSSNSLTYRFLEYLTSDYAVQLKNSSDFVTNKFATYTDSQLDKYMKQNLELWGGEFSREAFLRETMDYE